MSGTIMDLYGFNHDVYNATIKIVGFRFYRQIKDTGIVFQELLEARDVLKGNTFHILVCFDQEQTHYIRFNHPKVLMFQLREIAEKRLRRLISFEAELMKINDAEAYGENRYHHDTEMTAIGISSIHELLKHFETILKKL